MEDLQYYQEIAKEDIDRDKDKARIYQEIWDMVDLNYELPDAIQDIPWIGNRKFVSTAPRNADQAAIRTFASQLPTVDIMPTSPDPKEWDRVEKMEQAVMWHYDLMNRRGSKPVHQQIVESAIRFAKVAFQTAYVPYLMKGQKGKRVNAFKKFGDFSFIVHPAGNVHVRDSRYGMESVTLATNRRLIDLIYEFGRDNPGIQSFLGDKDLSGADLRSMEVTFMDYTDWDVRAIWFQEGWGNIEPGGHQLLLEEHDLDWIPWVVVDFEEPLLKTIALSESWKNANVIKAIEFSKHVELAGTPSYWTRSAQRGSIDVNTDEPGQPAELGPGDEIGQLVPPPIDQKLSKTIADLERDIHQSSAAQILGGVDHLVTGTTPFSAINQALQVAISQLNISKLCAERALEDGFTQMFRWIDKSDIPLMSYRKESNGEGPVARSGFRFGIYPGEADEELMETTEDQIWFDVNRIYIDVKLKANTPADEQTRINNAIMLTDRLGVSRETAYDVVGVQNFDREQVQWGVEQLTQASIQAEVQRIMQQVELEGQAKTLQMQMQMQQAQMAMQQQAQQQAQQGGPPGQPPAQPQNMRNEVNAGAPFAGAEGMNTRGGGVAPQGGAPGETREQVTGRTAGGGEVV